MAGLSLARRGGDVSAGPLVPVGTGGQVGVPHLMSHPILSP